MPHIVVAISAHGFGHVAQTAPVINRLRQIVPDLRVTLRTAAPEFLLRARFTGHWTLVRTESDFGMRMTSGLDVDAEASARAYADFHHDWRNKLRDEARMLATLRPDLVLANVPYLTLAGAAHAGLPTVALCSLNWADIYRHYCSHRPEADEILGIMRSAYASAGVFLQPEPSMPMADLPNRRPIGPIASLGVERRDTLRARLDLAADTRLVLVAPGGVPVHLDLDQWPKLPDVHWLVPEQIAVARKDMTALEPLGMRLPDLLTAVDAVIGKPGYGTFAETACHGAALLYVSRGDWPEEPYLVEWLQRSARALEIPRSAFERGDLGDALQALWQLPDRPPVMPTGVDVAARQIAECLLAGTTA
jgi:hypothetical protein